jgi:uncharacterized membrane protein HdeD (DUF308 family)
MFRTFSIAEGVLFLVLGVLSLLFPVVASFGVTALVGVAFLVGGMVGWISNLAARRGLKGWLVFWRLVVLTLFLVAGITILQQFVRGGVPAAAQVLALGLAIGIVFLVEGVVAIIASLSHRSVQGWGWRLANGIVTLVLGLLIITMKFWGLLSVLGILVGVSFLFTGFDLIAFGSSLHRLPGGNDAQDSSPAAMT